MFVTQFYFHDTPDIMTKIIVITRTNSTTTSRKRKRSQPRVTVKLNPLTFQRMLKQVVVDLYGVRLGGGTAYCFQSPALLRLQKAAEQFLEIMWDQIKDIATHGGREFDVQSRDVRIWKRLTGFTLRHNRSHTRSLCSMFDSLPPCRKL